MQGIKSYHWQFSWKLDSKWSLQSARGMTPTLEDIWLHRQDLVYLSYLKTISGESHCGLPQYAHRGRWTHHSSEGAHWIWCCKLFPYSTQDRKSVSTIKHFIVTIHHDDFLHPLGVKQGYIDNGLRDTDVNECQLTEDKQANLIDCTQRQKPTCIHPVDIISLDKDTIMHLNLQKFPV